jgi:hypothetical protein
MPRQVEVVGASLHSLSEAGVCDSLLDEMVRGIWCRFMVSDIAGLRPTLENLARTTWLDVAEGRRLGVPMGEIGITDRNMLALRREHPTLLVHKHSIHEEVRTGADWEWWLGTSDGWICLVFQAKLLAANGRYPGITKGQMEGKPQVDLLLRSCLRRSERLGGPIWPLYCFYNSWAGTWPEDVPKFDDPNPGSMANGELQLYGCATADAWSVRQVLFDPYFSMRRTLRDSYLPVSRPWSLIFPDPTRSDAYSPGQTLATLSSWIFKEIGPTAEAPPNDSEGAESGRSVRRDRLAVYSNPALIRRPPDYVIDLLEGKVHGRRLKPLARRVAILP